MTRLPSLAAVFCLLLGATTASAQPRFIDSGDAPWPDAMLATAVPLERARPVGEVGVLRSTRAPVAVHLGESVTADEARESLAWAETFLNRLQFELHFDLPAPDGVLGGGPELDLYLHRGAGDVAVFPEAMETVALWDRAPAWASLSQDGTAADRRRRVAEAVARAAILGHNADIIPSLLDALTVTVARKLTGDPPDLDAWRAYAAHPERAMITSPNRTPLENRGASLFFEWLIAHHDDDTHRLLGGLIAGPSQRSRVGYPVLFDEPDPFDIAQRVFRDEPGGFPRALLGFACFLRELGTPADVERFAGILDPTLASPPARTVTWAEMPAWRTVHRVEVNASAAVHLDLRDAPNVINGPLTLSVWLHLAPWHRWMVAVERRDAGGHTLGSVESEVISDGHWSTEITNLEDARSLDVVVLNLGAMTVDPDVPIPAAGFFSAHLAQSTGR